MTDMNDRRFEGKVGTYEVWYLTWNDPKTDCGYWLRYVIESPNSGEPYGEYWFARFDPQVSAALNELTSRAPFLKLLGSYPMDRLLPEHSPVSAESAS